jgi:AP-3 complex subunit beta
VTPAAADRSRSASTNSDLLLLSINTFQKDLSDPSPLIRSMSLRVLTSIRVPVIQGKSLSAVTDLRAEHSGIVMLGLKKLVNDRNPWVRKTVAGGLAKVYEWVACHDTNGNADSPRMDSSSLPSLLPLLQILLASPSPLTLGATLTAFSEICPDRLDLLHPYYRHICRLLVDADEWGQSVALEVLTRYARAMLEKPDTAGSAPPAPTPKTTGDIDAESEDEFDGLDIDLAMFLDCARPLFQSRNPAVVLAAARTYYHLAPSNNKAIGQELLVLPLLRLAGSTEGRVAGKEIASLTWEVIGSMVEERPVSGPMEGKSQPLMSQWLFAKHLTSFYVHTSEPVAVKTNKIRAMRVLVSAESAQASLREFKVGPWLLPTGNPLMPRSITREIHAISFAKKPFAPSATASGISPPSRRPVSTSSCDCSSQAEVSGSAPCPSQV